MVADFNECRRAATLFADPRHGFELVALTSGTHRTIKGDDIDGIVDAVRFLPSGIGIYFRINPVPLGLVKQAKAGDTMERRWLFIDVDPVKPDKDSPATDEEKAATAVVCDAVVQHLEERGWPAPVIGDSGNGIALFYRCDLPNDPLTQAAYRNLLIDLDKRFSNEHGHIDKSVHNANRLAKLPGTWAKKGTPSDDRPFRPAKLLSVPSELIPVTFQQLAAAVDAPAPPPAAPVANPVNIKPSLNGHHKTNYGRRALDLECSRVVLAQTSGEGRNNALNRAAFSLSQLVAGGELLEGEVRDRLYEAAIAAGLDRDPGCGERGILLTIESGFKAGMEKPRAAPPPKQSPRAVIGSAAEPLEPGEALTIKLSKVEPSRVEWLIKDRIPKRFITIFAGRTGVGKSFVSHDLIARISTGGEIPFGGGECFKPGGTLILSEDSPEFVLAPRLAEAGADMTRIHCMTWKAMANYHLGNTEMLGKAVDEVGNVSLVMIDPPTNFLAETDGHKDTEVRQLVMRVVEWAFERDLAVLFILHVNKQSGKGVEALNRVMGSVAWVTTSRIAHTLCIDPDDPKQCLWVPLKNNLGKLAKAISYRITGTNDAEGRARVEWLAEVDTTADEALGHQPRQRRDVAASEWLIEQFREKLEWDSDDLFRAAAEANVSRSAIFEAKKLLALPRAKRRVSENGDTTFLWWVPEDWTGFNGPTGSTGKSD